jgi:hypothetical protein
VLEPFLRDKTGDVLEAGSGTGSTSSRSRATPGYRLVAERL